jgi:acyl-CoA synthetase (NDP forming)
MTTETIDCNVATELEEIFNPRSIAIVGVSNSDANNVREMFLKSLLDYGFEGQIYPVNPKGGQVLGLKVYRSVLHIPGPVDCVTAGIPAQFGPELVRECGQKGVKVVQFFSSGFSEIGTDEGTRLEAELAQAARETKVRVIGPNCMGIHCPESKIVFWSEFPTEPGPVGYMCQSGGNSIHLVKLGAPRGMRFSKVISYGNACDLNECDFLEYLAQDPSTEIIAVYIEGVRDGQRFTGVLREAAQQKPVVLFKGGDTEGGTRAAASHTGSLAGSNAAWEALCKQLGVLQVHSMDELSDVLITLLHLSTPRGKNALVMSGAGGGASVIGADDCERNGLTVPILPKVLQDKILEFTPHAGNSIRNPIDSNLAMFAPDLFVKTAEIASGWEGIDLMIAPLRPTSFYIKVNEQRLQYKGIAEAIMRGASASLKPAAIVVEPDVSPELTKESFAVLQECVSHGFPTYPSVARAARAISKVIDHKGRKTRSSRIEEDSDV